MKMKLLGIILLVSFPFVLGFAGIPIEEGENSVEVGEVERSCINVGDFCDGKKDDCQCCRDNAFCSCSVIFGYKTNCRCEVGTTATSYGICMAKHKCGRQTTCTKPCLSKRCKKNHG
uniref:Omega-ctenitoxin-Pn3a n=1 Tax=Phoneutria nigriventer TaxID=6918 RepID=TX34_PHONI|nr:RecName: Full=Omega-ctenitoxin-Pn3a; Short=Omega-CNTX-Pn3a; AltName: Full=Neurotoxin Tx3-4; AltName: Full=Omega-phonetoxin-2A; AltName: Full=Omega-phonetoxin-IIA; Short=Omega-Ptx-IIA; AltName: Full=PF3; AltName: Full=Phoneutriatoxin 3-4; AltName: Full=Pn3-4A; Flags: Precursor [Phoneutria nigriventer]